ncbi:BolA family protein [Besnoitia besnoiti]|uniref:BolA family protein n=1 Tax=Besnoitia besnoiti TaxID=94643 RepID=A0A2A9MBU3_BESBE|nr:BolA family protein [Besnoitia besnoiti]PFH33087.1 BolA family protein [Besnoitia besnoiti]
MASAASSGGVQHTVLEKKLQQALSPAVLKLEDKSCGCGAAYDCVVVSSAFDGKRLLERHRMVNEALKEELPSIHAFSMQCHTPQEWEKKQAN